MDAKAELSNLDMGGLATLILWSSDSRQMELLKRTYMLDVKLVVVGGDAKAAEVKLNLPTIIGRGKEAGLTVPHALVSRRHTEIFEQDGSLFVKDLGSLNGTFVNNLRIDDAQPLEPNQLLTLGNITFRAVYEKQHAEVLPASDPTEASRETVTFEEVNTTEEFVENSKESKKVIEKAAEETPRKVAKPFVQKTPEKNNDVTLDETVPIESLGNLKKAAPKGNTKDRSESASVVDSEEQPKSSAADTDKSFVSSTPTEGDGYDSSIFSFEETGAPANQSVSASSLDNLPTGLAAALSFVGGIDLGDEAPSSVTSPADPVEIELGDETEKSKVDQDSSLGSFLKKLPR